MRSRSTRFGVRQSGRRHCALMLAGFLCASVPPARGEPLESMPFDPVSESSQSSPAGLVAQNSCGSTQGGPRATPRASGGLDYEDVADEAPATVTPPATPAKPPRTQRLGELSVKRCREGSRRSAGAPTTIRWQRMARPERPAIRIGSELGYGEYASKGMSASVRAFEQALEGLQRAVSRVGSAGTVAGGAAGVAGLGAKAAAAAADFGRRTADRKSRALRRLEVRIPMMTATLLCQAQELCTGGRWVAATSAPVPGSLETPAAKDGSYDKGDLGASEIQRHITKAMNRFRPEYDRLAAFASDPCAAPQADASKPGTSTQAGSGSATAPENAAAGRSADGRDCRPILDELRAKERLLKAATDAHAEAHRPLLEDQTRRLRVDADRASAKRALEDKIPAAEREAKLARQARDNLASFRGAQTREDLDRMEAALRRETERARKAEGALQELGEQSAAIDRRFDAEARAIDARIASAQAEIARLAAEKTRLDAETKALQQRYIDCRAGR